MLVLIPLFSYFLLWRVFRQSGSGRRRAALEAAVSWAVLLTFFTELLSALSLVTRGWLAAAWAAACLVEIAWLVKSSPAKSRLTTASVKSGLPRADRILLWLAGVLVASTGLLAVLAPPNTWDAMEYHLPRVMMWVSNHNVNHFPTPDYAQLVFAPATEYVVTHLYLLWGGDRLVNLVNFTSFVGLILAASLIAQTLGAGARGQAFAALFVATIPEALLEASGAMNTAGVAFWIVAAIYFVLASNEEQGWRCTAFAGLAVGMALLTKGSAYIYLPFVLLACWWIGSRTARIRMLRRLPALALIVVALNGAQFVRAYEFTGSPLGMPFPAGGPYLRWMRTRITPGNIVANVIRNAGLHLETPSGRTNERIDNAMRWTIRKIGQDPDDPDSIWQGLPFVTNRRSVHEAYAGNPFHFAVIVAVCVFVVFNVRELGSAQLRWYTTGVILGFVLFSALLHWQIWNARHHLPVFALFAPLVGLTVERLLSGRAAILFGALLLLSGLPFVYSNKLRSYVPWRQVVDIYRPRADLYFADQHMPWAPSYEEFASRLRATGCHDVGIKAYLPVPEARIEHSPESFFVYPLLALVGVDGQNMRARYVGIQNPTARYARSDAPDPPCVIACLDCVGHPEAVPEYSGFRSVESAVGQNEVVTFLASAPARP